MNSPLLSFLLNLPYTTIGLFTALMSFPRNVTLKKKPWSIIVKVKSFWWTKSTYLRWARAMTIGHTILLGPKEERRDLEHELVHVKQYSQEPLIFPILYYIERFKKGYRASKYEDQAYTESGSIYRGSKL